MPNKSVTVLNGDGSTRTITIPDRSRYAGRRTISSGYVYPAQEVGTPNEDYFVLTKTDDRNWRVVSDLSDDTLGEHNGGKKFTSLGAMRTGLNRISFDVELHSGDLTDPPEGGYAIRLSYRDKDDDPVVGAAIGSVRVTEGRNEFDFNIFNDGDQHGPQMYFAYHSSSKFDVSITNLKIIHNPRDLSVDRTAAVNDSDRKGESRPLLSKVVGGASAAYSLRDLNDKAGNNKVVRVRRDTDNSERDFLANEIGKPMENWVNTQSIAPLDIGTEVDGTRVHVKDGGTSIGTPVGAYSLRSLGTNQWEYAGDTLEYESDFSAGVDVWNSTTGTATGNIDGIGGQNDNLRFSINTSTNYPQIFGGVLTVGSTYDIYADVYLPSTNTQIDGIRVQQGGGGGKQNYQGIATDTWVTVSLKNTSGGNSIVYFGALNGSAETFTGNGTDVFYVRNVKVYESLGDTEYLPSDKYVVQVRRQSDAVIKSFTADNLKEKIEEFCGEVDIDDTRPAIPVDRYKYSADVTTEIIDPRSSVKFTLNGATDSRYLHLTTLGLGKYKFTGSIHIKADSRNATMPLALYIAHGVGVQLEDTSHGTTGTTFTWTEDNPLIFETTKYPNWTPREQGTALQIYNHGVNYQNFVSISNAEITVTNFKIQQVHTDARVVTWYDQSGNDNHITIKKEDYSSRFEPIICDAGEFKEELDFDGIDDLMEVPFELDINPAGGSEFASFIVAAYDKSASTENQILLRNSGTTPLHSFAFKPDGAYSVSLKDGTDTANIGSGGRDLGNNQYHLFNTLIEETAGRNFIDGTVVGEGLSLSSIDSTSNPSNETLSTEGNPFAGRVKEIILYDTAQLDNRAAIEANIGDYYGLSAVPTAVDNRNGYVVKWYDQSGNGVDAYTYTESYQPMLVENGVVTRNTKGQPAIKFDPTCQLDFHETNTMNQANKFISKDGTGAMFTVFEKRNQLLVNHETNTGSAWTGIITLLSKMPNYSYNSSQGQNRISYVYHRAMNTDTETGADRRRVYVSYGSHSGPSPTPEYGEVFRISHITRPFLENGVDDSHQIAKMKLAIDAYAGNRTSAETAIHNDVQFVLNSGVWSGTANGKTYTVSKTADRWSVMEDATEVWYAESSEEYPWKISGHEWKRGTGTGTFRSFGKFKGVNGVDKNGFDAASTEVWSTAFSDAVTQPKTYNYKSGGGVRYPVMVRNTDVTNHCRIGTRITNEDRTTSWRATGGEIYMSEIIYYKSAESLNRPAIDHNIDNYYQL